MIGPIDVIDCNVERPEWPFMPVRVVCGSSRTVAVVGLPAGGGLEITGYQVRITNAAGVSLTKTCVKHKGQWLATFPASHFENCGSVKKGVVVFASGKDENGDTQFWILRVGDLVVSPVDASSLPGGVVETPRDVYHKTAIVDGVQHYKREVLTYSERQRAWGAEYVGDYIFVGGDYVPFGG